jgi:hypothetical protein
MGIAFEENETLPTVTLDGFATRIYFRDFGQLLTRHGYRLHRIVPDCRLWSIPTYTESHECFPISNDLAECGAL